MKKNHKNNTNRVWSEKEERYPDRNKTMNEASEAADIEERINTATPTQDTDEIESKEQESVNTKETTDDINSKLWFLRDRYIHLITYIKSQNKFIPL